MLSTGGFCIRLCPRISARMRWYTEVARYSAFSSVSATTMGMPSITYGLSNVVEGLKWLRYTRIASCM
ncbi:hypothetical protein D3C75_959900 [compost metagenome]